jgi:hypothetical protein
MTRAEREFNEGFDNAVFGASRKEIARMTDMQLASRQARYEAGSAQQILAEHEWQSRRVAKQLRGAYIAALLGLVGVVLGWALRSYS